MTRIVKRENPIKDAFWHRFEQLHPVSEYVVTQHQDVRTCGHPDNTVNGCGSTTWWEFKHATPNFTTYGLQELMCLQLSHRSYCRYVIFFEYRDVFKTLIVHPRALFQKKGKLDKVVVETEFDGRNFDALASFIHSVHILRQP